MAKKSSKQVGKGKATESAKPEKPKMKKSPKVKKDYAEKFFKSPPGFGDE